jgi:hypothetical protein
VQNYISYLEIRYKYGTARYITYRNDSGPECGKFFFFKHHFNCSDPSSSADTENDPDRQVRSGPALVLQFIVSLLGMDLERWSGRQLTGTAQPLLARVLFSGGSVRWNRRCEILSSKYVAALQLPDTAASHSYLSSLRFGFIFDN